MKKVAGGSIKVSGALLCHRGEGVGGGLPLMLRGRDQGASPRKFVSPRKCDLIQRVTNKFAYRVKFR